MSSVHLIILTVARDHEVLLPTCSPSNGDALTCSYHRGAFRSFFSFSSSPSFLRRPPPRLPTFFWWIPLLRMMLSHHHPRSRNHHPRSWNSRHLSSGLMCCYLVHVSLCVSVYFEKLNPILENGSNAWISKIWVATLEGGIQSWGGDFCDLDSRNIQILTT